MKLMERDFLLFKWVNSHGYVTSFQINRFLNVAKTTGYRRIKKLVDAGYLTRENLLHGVGAVHRITKQAKEISNENLSLIQKISLGGYNHNIRLVDLALDFERQYPDATFVTERQIRFINGVGLSDHGHIPDGEIQFSNDKKWAIELEISVKASSRLDKIMKYYARNMDYSEVHYYVSDNIVFNAIQKAVDRAKLNHIKIINMEDDK